MGLIKVGASALSGTLADQWKKFYGVTTQVQEEVLFQISYRTDITTANVIAFRGVNYEITRIDTFKGYKEDLVLYCKVKE